MKKLLFVLCLLTLSQASAIYEMGLTIWKNDSVTMEHFAIRTGTPDYFPQQGDEKYEFRIISENGTGIYSKTFYLSFVTYPFRGPNATEPDEVNISKIYYDWKLPYYDDASLIQLFHADKKIFEYWLPNKTQPSKPSLTGQKPAETDNLIIYAATGIFILILAFLLYRAFAGHKKSGGT